MLTHPMLDQLAQLGLTGMAQAFAELEASGEGATLTHADWLGLLLDREITHRRDKRLAARLRYASLRHQAVVEDVDYRAPRGLDRALFHKLAGGEWIDAHDNLILCGPTGVGKSWLACALGHKACRDNRSVLYQRVPKLFADLALARGDGRYARIMRTLSGAQLLILDDWGLDPLDAGARRDLYEILEERYGRRSTILTSQVPVDKWHEVIGDPTYADAILDRLVHNAHRIDLTGDSLRRARTTKACQGVKPPRRQTSPPANRSLATALCGSALARGLLRQHSAFQGLTAPTTQCQKLFRQRGIAARATSRKQPQRPSVSMKLKHGHLSISS